MMRREASLLAVSVLAVALVASYEGYRYLAYDDRGTPAIGYGAHRYETGEPVRPGDRISPERAVVLLSRQLAQVWQQVAGCIGQVPLTQGEVDAYASLAYNIGPARFCASTLVRKLRGHPPDYAGACRELLRWTKVGGRESPGLVARRQAEYRRCTGEA
jgi:lysozyme